MKQDKSMDYSCSWKQLLGGAKNRKLTGSNTTMKKQKDETGKLVSSTRV